MKGGATVEAPPRTKAGVGQVSKINPKMEMGQVF